MIHLIDFDSALYQISIYWNSVPFNKPGPPILQVVCPNDDHNTVDLNPVTHHVIWVHAESPLQMLTNAAPTPIL